jgi:hypothetical protein
MVLEQCKRAIGTPRQPFDNYKPDTNFQFHARINPLMGAPPFQIHRFASLLLLPDPSSHWLHSTLLNNAVGSNLKTGPTRNVHYK